MGGDNAPAIVVDGAARALERNPELRFIMIGDTTKISPILANHPSLQDSVGIFDIPISTFRPT